MRRRREQRTSAGASSSSTSRITLHEYAREWIERYQGTGRRGFREETRDEYRALLNKYALAVLFVADEADRSHAKA